MLRCSNRFWIGAVLLTFATFATALQADDPSGQPDPAAQFGALMTEHWFIADLARQADRALFYTGTTSNSLLTSLQGSLAAAEARLLEARALFSTPNSKAQVPSSQIAQVLEAVAAQDQSNRRSAESLLQEVGSATDPHFRAIVVPRETLRPNLRNLRLTDFRPNRILFGSTAAPGDARVAALQFDFCKALFGFYAPMSGPGQLALSESLRSRADPTYTWMRSAQVGYRT